jgi:Na+/melibiose symporter-like transporter
MLFGLPADSIALWLCVSAQADVIDYEELLNGVRSEGIFSVYATLVNKTVAIPASAIPLAILSALGFIYPVNGVDQVCVCVCHTSNSVCPQKLQCLFNSALP